METLELLFEHDGCGSAFSLGFVVPFPCFLASMRAWAPFCYSSQTSIPTEKDQRRRGWVVSVPVKEEGRSRESYVESARNGFRKFLLFAFLHGR
ncbi:hypothetical protein NC651_006881 [Populus alba x Populus x berolinensis]|nr:hypothetical protein NC651_006881 [Populus alba x Populus x berolinensis]